MQYRLKLIGFRPTAGDLVLHQEEGDRKLAGQTLVDTAAALIRRSVDDIQLIEHEVLGTLAEYNMLVPAVIAAESGRFVNSNDFTIICTDDLLWNYVFYLPEVRMVSGSRPCYPKSNKSSLAIVSHIDELGFLNDWASIGYPMFVGWCSGKLTKMVPAAEDGTTYPNSSCSGCTANCYCSPSGRPGGSVEDAINVSGVTLVPYHEPDVGGIDNIDGVPSEGNSTSNTGDTTP